LKRTLLKKNKKLETEKNPSNSSL